MICQLSRHEGRLSRSCRRVYLSGCVSQGWSLPMGRYSSSDMLLFTNTASACAGWKFVGRLVVLDNTHDAYFRLIQWYG